MKKAEAVYSPESMDKELHTVQTMRTVNENGRTRVTFMDTGRGSDPDVSKLDAPRPVRTTRDRSGRTHVLFDEKTGQESYPDIQTQISGRSYVNFDSPGRMRPRCLGFESRLPVEKSVVNLDVAEPAEEIKVEASDPSQISDWGLDDVWAEDQWGTDCDDWTQWEAEAGDREDSESEPDLTGRYAEEEKDSAEPKDETVEDAPGPVPVSIQSIFDKESNLSTSDIFAALVQAEEASLVASASPKKGSPNDAPRYGQRHRVTLPLWPLDDVVLKELLAFWQSSSCHYGGDHQQRLKYVAKYLAFEEESPKAGSLNIRVQMTDTAKVTRYLDFLSSKHQSPATILKSLDMIRHTLNWVVMRRLKPKGKKYIKKYTGCCQAREVLAELRSAWQTVSNRDSRRTTTIGSILRANKWPTDDEVQTLVDKALPEYKGLRARCKHEGQVTDSEMQWVLSLMANACTIHVTFGRPSLFQRLTVAHGEKAVKSQVVGTSEFKTWSKWFINSMYFAGGARSLLKDWLEIWRPMVAPGEVKPADPLFVDRNNKAIENWSRVLSLLWERTFDRSMTTTILRYWKATKVALRAETEEERKLVFEADWSDYCSCGFGFLVILCCMQVVWW